MAHAILVGTHAGSTLREAIDLAKPRITSMVVFTTAVGLALPPGSIGAPRSFLLLVGTALIRSIAKADRKRLNCAFLRSAESNFRATRCALSLAPKHKIGGRGWVLHSPPLTHRHGRLSPAE